MAVTKKNETKAATPKAETTKVAKAAPVEVAKTEVKEKAAEPAKKPAAKTAAKAPAKKAAAPAKKAATADKPKKTTAAEVKNSNVKTGIHVQFDGKSYAESDFIKSAMDVWKFDLGKKASDLKSIELYIKPEESTAYYVMNGNFTGSFYI